MKNSMEITFWGVRGSYPATGNETAGFGGNTSCIEISAAGHTLIFDAGTGLIPLGKDLISRWGSQSAPTRLCLFFSHLHHDHTQGFPFFAPAYNPSNHLRLFSPDFFSQGIEEALSRLMGDPSFPIAYKELGAEKEAFSLKESQAVVLGGLDDPAHIIKAALLDPETHSGALVVRCLRSYAHPGGTFIYRVEWNGISVVYATDTEGYQGGDRRLIDFARGADLLIHDAQYSLEHYQGQTSCGRPTQGFGHSTPEMACEVAEKAGVRTLALFHHDPEYNDSMLMKAETSARLFFPNTIAANEGLQILLNPGSPASILRGLRFPRPLSTSSPARIPVELPTCALSLDPALAGDSTPGLRHRFFRRTT